MQKLKYTIEVSPEEMTAELQAFLETHNAQLDTSHAESLNLPAALEARIHQDTAEFERGKRGKSWQAVKEQVRSKLVAKANNE